MNSFLGLTPRECFERRLMDSWLFGVSQVDWIANVQAGVQELEQWSSRFSGSPRVMVLSHEPLVVLTAFMSCAIARCPVFMGNPAWGQMELEKAHQIAQPHLIWQDSGLEEISNQPCDCNQEGWILIPTGGTSGQIKFAIHTWETLLAAVVGMQEFFGAWAQPIHSCCVLPLHHVSGLMQFIRSFVTGGALKVLPYKVFLSGETDSDFLSPESSLNQAYFLSLVPTQLSRFLEQNEKRRILWLSQFQCILLGGAPASQDLLTQSKSLGLKIAPTYGMTETAAQVMTLHPNDFLAGVLPPGTVLPHVNLTLLEREKNIGVMQWQGDSLFYGYFPDYQKTRLFQTDDLAQLLPDGSLQLIGRDSRKIISGGENIYPEEIEAALMAMNDIEDVWIFGVEDLDWGQIAIAAYVSTEDITSEQLIVRLKQQLASYKCPKKWMKMESIPRNEQGKVQSAAIMATWLQHMA